MSDTLYSLAVLRLAAEANGAGRLEAPDGSHTEHNPTCGDRVDVTLRLDANGRIVAMAHEESACVLAQASASILGKHLEGADASAIEHLRAQVAAMLREAKPVPAPFGDYAALAGAATFRNRHNCVLLPIDAVLDAFKDK